MIAAAVAADVSYQRLLVSGKHNPILYLWIKTNARLSDLGIRDQSINQDSYLPHYLNSHYSNIQPGFENING